jgi:hypothetical protein
MGVSRGIRMKNQQKKSWHLRLGIAGAFFCLTVGILVHDSLGLTESVSQSEIHEIAVSRPILYDVLGKPMKVSEEEFQAVLMKGGFRARPGSTIAMLTPQNQVTVIDISQAPMALMRGWSVETLEHELNRIIQAKQHAFMWLGDDQDLWFQSALCWMSAIMLLSMVFLAREEHART